jgi:hypothetical protein
MELIKLASDCTSLEAFVYYLYTGKISFAHLSSQPENREDSSQRSDDITLITTPRCSPKSMYRLADKVRHDGLPRLPQR